MTYRIAFATGSRADYGIVRRYLDYLNNDKELNLEIIVTGSLLEEQYGNSYTIIDDDGFNIVFKAPLGLNSENNASVIKSMAIALDTFGTYFEDNKYNLLIILGDRYEMLSIAIAAAMNKIPILHIHGGEITLGNYDEFIRHSITKMSHYHFTSTEEYRNRVIQLGENPENVYYIGAMGSENCKIINKLNIPIEIKKLPKKKYFVVLFHPETLTDVSPLDQIQVVLNAIKNYIKEYIFVFIGTNADTGSNKIREEISNYISLYDNAIYYENLHPDAYHFLVKNSIALIGNSSSGIIEAPTLGTYTINIGDRQKGRVRGDSVIDVICLKKQIVDTIRKVINSDMYRTFNNPYYLENSSQKAYTYTKSIIKKEHLIKNFYDLEFND